MKDFRDQKVRPLTLGKRRGILSTYIVDLLKISLSYLDHPQHSFYHGHQQFLSPLLQMYYISSSLLANRVLETPLKCMQVSSEWKNHSFRTIIRSRDIKTSMLVSMLCVNSCFTADICTDLYFRLKKKKKKNKAKR